MKNLWSEEVYGIFLGLLIALIIPFNSYSQTDTVRNMKWSQYISTDKNYQPPSVIGNDDTSIFVLRYKRKRLKKLMFIEKYDLASMSLENSLLIETEFEGKNLDLISQFMFGSKPTLFFYDFNSESEKINYYLLSIDPSSLEMESPKLVTQQGLRGLSGPLSGSINSLTAKSAVTLEITEDRQLAIIFTSRDGIVYNAVPINEFVCSVIDSEFNKLETFNIELPWENFIPIKTKLTDEGDYYLLGYHYDPNLSSRVSFGSLKSKSQDFHLVKINISDGSVRTLDIENDGMEIENLTFQTLNNGNCVVAGLFVGELGAVQGAFFIQYDKENNEVSRYKHPFELDFIDTKWYSTNSTNSANSDDSGLYNYQISDLIINENGTVSLLAEQFYIIEVITTIHEANGHISTTLPDYRHHYDDIIVINFNSEGSLNWKKTISKEQISLNDDGYGLSFFQVPINNELSIFYNDYKTPGRDDPSMKNVIAIQLRLDELGFEYLDTLYEKYGETGVKLIPKASLVGKNNIGIVYSRGRSFERFGIIEEN